MTFINLLMSDSRLLAIMKRVNLKFLMLFVFVMSSAVLNLSCVEEIEDLDITEGKVRLRGRGYAEYGFMRIPVSDQVYPLGKKTGSRMHTLDLIVNVRDIWVSQDTLVHGGADNQKWYRIYEGNELQSWAGLKGPEVQLPAGTYRSIKIVFNNVFYRKACFADDTTKVWLMKETMGSWTDACDDTLAIAPTDYIDRKGLCYMNTQGKLILTQPNEKFGSFEIRHGKMTNLYWKLGDERNISPCLFWFDWFDENGNGVWDCGTDRMDNFDQSPSIQPPVESMFTFIAEYE